MSMRVHVEGIGVWSPQLADFAALHGQLQGTPAPAPAGRPPAATLPANERRRAPESVLLAIEVAGQAVAMSGRAPAELACVFGSAFGDLSITDYMCETLAHAPTELSPTRFHNSVHNAAAGYWTIATGCHAPSSAVCAWHDSIGAGLLEAAAMALADQRPVLFVCSDVAGAGPLAPITRSTQAFGCAFVLAPEASPRTLATLSLQLAPRVATHTDDGPLPAAWSEANATAAAALPLLVVLAGRDRHCQMAAAGGLGLEILMENVA
ncbi:beta-ketoacyl synthase chain length factor [Dyella sp. LX-66]|uniref:beta-ketoacyl synthase chain length factor n=1 Tax=unclassified Dyella TaxID=2634549 RepID=UPI001BDF823D|nr:MULTISPECIES: beta-ketoacyl synthase chain length factor [unclassified Dyella]MBT2119454.1 beta-ketoacyl synthase chain length factor [Dyella sp. LX-1]MBT2141830.1 beta-ketoacyl synthase chain length factor [Dyella sp. LX-66]